MNKIEINKPVFIHEIKLTGSDEFSEKFNTCSDLWQRSMDESLSEAERKEAWGAFIQRRQALEMGL